MANGIAPDFIQSDMSYTARIFTLSPHFTEADQAIADLTINHPQTVARLSARQIGNQCGE
jgi:DNA-binding MurR/RpiR family transcriptional regulator